jgi:hypothetical protein
MIDSLHEYYIGHRKFSNLNTKYALENGNMQYTSNIRVQILCTVERDWKMIMYDMK